MRAWLVLLLVPFAVSAQESWRVAGTIIGEARASVLIENSTTGVQRQLHVGDTLDGCGIREIAAGGMRLNCSGVMRWRGLEKDDALVLTGKSATATTAELSDRAFRDLLKDRQRLVSEISLKPRVHDGRQDGYEVEHLKSGGLLEGHGLIAGDVILAVNGSPASQPQGFMETIRQLDKAPDFLLQLERDGALRELQVRLR